MKKNKVYYHIVVQVGKEQFEAFNEDDLEKYYDTVFIPHQSDSTYITINGFKIYSKYARVLVYKSDEKITNIATILEVIDDNDLTPFDASENGHDITTETLAEAKRRSLHTSEDELANRVTYRILSIAICLFATLLGISSIYGTSFLEKLKLGICILVFINSIILAIYGKWEWTSFSKIATFVGFFLAILLPILA